MKKTGNILPAIHRVGDTRFELVTPSVSGKCATTAPTARVILQPNQSRLIGLSRADNGTRTRGLNLGKVALYQLSYVRKGIRREKRNPVGDVGIEPTTPSV